MWSYIYALLIRVERVHRNYFVVESVKQVESALPACK
jgi:hypothetical protein